MKYKKLEPPFTGDIIQILKDKSRKDKKQNEPTYTYKTNILERLGIVDGKQSNI